MKNEGEKYFKLLKDYWFKIVVIIFLVIFYNQFNDILKYVKWSSDVTIDSFSRDALRDLKSLK